MADYSQMTMEELQAELEKNQGYLEDAQEERNFMGLQTGQHIKVADFARVDDDIERYQRRIQELQGLLNGK